MNIISVKKVIFCLSLTALFSLGTFAQEPGAVFVPWSSIPSTGTVLVYTHQDDDLIWMLPWWNKVDKFISGSMPTTWHRRDLIHEQQLLFNSGGYGINFEPNWITPWPDITPEVYNEYYNNENPAYNYVALDHIEARLSTIEDLNRPLSRTDINKIKAKIEAYIADPSVQRIITHNDWGEYGHQHHRATNLAVRELAVKYRKDVWMLGSDGGTANGNIIDNVVIPDSVTYTKGTFDSLLYVAIRNLYYQNNVWTWFNDVVPNGEHNYIKVVDGGKDLSLKWPNTAIAGTPGPVQLLPGSYIFDGDDDFLTMPGNNNPVSTIAMRIYPDQIRAMDISHMSEYPASTTFDRSLYMESDGRITARIFDGTNRSVTSTTALTAGNWAHVTMVTNGTNLRLYINGQLEGTINAGTARTDYATPEFVIGQAQETASCFSGQITNVKLFDYELSDNDINYLSGTTTPVFYTVTASSASGGSISPSGLATVVSSSNRTFAITPAVGYQVADVLVDGVSVGTPLSYTFTNITANHTIAASFSALVSVAINKPATGQTTEGTYTASLAVDSDPLTFWGSNDGCPQWWRVDLGAVYDLSGIIVRHYVDGYRYYHYYVESSIDGVNYTQIASKTNNNVSVNEGDQYPLSGVSARYLRVTTTFNITGGGAHIGDFKAFGTVNSNYHMITASVGTGGTLSPTGDVTLTNGSNQTYTINPGVGYSIADVLVDGVSAGAVSSYTFSNITANHTISVTFTPAVSIALNKPATAQSFEYAGVGPEMANDTDGTNGTYWSASPYPQWWQVDLGAVYSVNGVVIRNYVDYGRYYQYNIQASIDGTNFTQIASKTSTDIAADAGDSYPVNVTARYLRVNMTFNSANTSVHISDFRAYGTIDPSYHKITSTVGSGGYITPSGDVFLAGGGSQTYTITPGIGSRISDVTVDGVSVGVVTSYTISNVTSNHTIHAEFISNPSLALNKTATAQSSEFGYEPQYANDADGTNNSRWSSGGTNPQWWMVDLGDNYDVNGIIVRNYVDGWRYYHYNVEASADGTTFTQVAQKTNDEAATDAGDSYSITSTTARYLRVTVTYNAAGPGAHICDFRVYGNYRISATAGTGGSISPSGVSSVSYGASRAYSISANTGYIVGNVTVDGVSVGAVSSYTFSNVTANHSISATFIQTHNITTITGAGGTITPSGTVTVNHGASQSFAIAANTGYKIASVKVDNVTVGTGTSYTFTNVTTDHTISATFVSLTPSNLALNKPTTCQSFQTGHESSYANDADGTNNSYWSATPYSKWWKVDLEAIYDLTSVVIRNFVSGNRSYQYTIQVSTDDVTYTTVASKVNRNAAVNNGDTYNITATARYIRVNMTYSSTNMSVNITDFRAYGTPSVGLPTYTLLSSAGANGSLSPSGSVIVNRGTKQTYAIIPNSGYQVSDVLVDGVSAGALTSYTFNYVTANHDISATFKTLNTYTISSSANTGGTIDPAGSTVVNEGASQTYTITADPGYAIDMVLVDNNPVGAVSAYTFTNVSAGHTIQAVFVPVYQIFAFIPDVDRGTINPADVTVVKQGGNMTYTIAANSGYAIEQVYVDGEPVGAVSTYTFTNVTTDHFIYATFLPQYQIFAFVPDVDRGSISPVDLVMVTEGGSQTFTITANPGYAIDDVVVDGNSLGAVSTYTFTNVATDHYIYVMFVPTHQIFAFVPAVDEGSITPVDIIDVKEGSSQTFTITPSQGYEIDQLFVDGDAVGALLTYTFTNVLIDHTIFPTFRLIGSGGAKGSSTTSATPTATIKGQDGSTSSVTESVIAEPKLNVYPNPFRDYFKMTVSGPEEALYTVSVVNLNGKTLYTQSEVPSNTEITIDQSFDPGIYVLVVTNKNTRMQMRIVKY